MPERYSYTTIQAAEFAAMRPLLDIAIIYGEQKLTATGLLDSGADINVLSYELGLQLGAEWEAQTVITGLSGNLATYEARGILVRAIVGGFPAVRLAFAWTRAEAVPLILGQVNFFLEFDVCFFRTRNAFEIEPRNNH